ncbi:hypothetical protein [Occallatibacter riparius]|uniref:Uncharacterized protein n=1 Tax=Occallatibacter riparius TaxID=1002689 RepID=A0A9J7BNV7_9BACT|nr:hypothetical protein [Occallatibacter riparius]UWZ84303.1 hypothetical protein MOP44_27620 [Occallatibacter riparius]
MYIPLVRESVRVRGHSGTFYVQQVDYHREVAHLASSAAEKKAPHIVNFEELFATWEDPDREQSHQIAR